MARPSRPTRSAFAAWRSLSTRWADVDVYGHVNNARYFELMDTAVNAYLAEASGHNIRRLDAVGLVAEVSCTYFAELHYPPSVDLGLAIERMGNSSICYRIGLFQDSDDAAALGRFVHVYTTRTDRGRVSAQIPDIIRAAVTDLPVYAEELSQPRPDARNQATGVEACRAAHSSSSSIGIGSARK